MRVEKDLPGLEKLQALIIAIAKSYDLPPAMVAAVTSRESGGGRLLGKNGCPPDTGDRGHGRGLMQIDDRWHRAFIGIDELWRQPAANIAYGCFLLRKNLDAVNEKLPGHSDEERLRVALAGYNCGLSRAIKAVASGQDIDAYTAGRDYSRDVMETAEWLKARGW